MNIKCPHCGTEYEVEKKDMYRYVKCSVCGKGFVAGADISTQGSVPSKQQVAMPSRFQKPQTQDGKAAPAPYKKQRSKMGKVVFVISITLGALVLVGAATFGGYLYFGDKPRLNRGILFYELRDYPKAYKLLLPLARKGYSKAQLIIGDCYANGQGAFMDTEEAVKWYRVAADQELPEAQHRMFVCCRDGVGMERNKENSAKWCRKAAEAGFEEAMFDMGMLYVNGTGVEQNAKSAFKWFRKGAERGYPPSLYQFGQCYKVGYGVEKDEDEAQKWQNKAVAAWRTSASTGDTDAMVRLAKLYEAGDVVELDKEEAVKWYRKGAELGNEIAQYELATCYHNGAGVEEDQEESAKWMLKAAEQSADRGVQWAMGRYYQEGWGGEKNPVEAVKWFERSAKKGFSMAKYYLAICHLKGEGVQKDEVKAEQLLEEAADAGEKDAQKELNRICEERAAEERRIAREKAEKRGKIASMVEIESEISNRKERINSILKGKFVGDWDGFNAGKIAQTDSSVSIKEEEPLAKISGTFTENDSLGKLTDALRILQKESARLEARLAEIAKVKGVYDAKELESRKETCILCGGNGAVACARCKGKGEVDAGESEYCTVCHGVGSVERNVKCVKCNGKGSIREKCAYCWRQNGVRKKNCTWCGGSGLGEDKTCKACFGTGFCRGNAQCSRCRGNGIVRVDTKESCPVCGGKCKLKCERCGGCGFTYRPKQ